MTPRLTITSKEFADMLGVCVSTLRSMSTAGKIPPPLPICKPRLPYWSKEMCINWINSGCPIEDGWAAIHKERVKKINLSNMPHKKKGA